MAKMTFSKKVRRRLSDLKLSQSDLADAIGTHQPQVSKWLGSDTIPSAAFLLRIARTLGVSVDFLIDDKRESAGEGLSEEQQRVLWLAEKVGYETAIKRITMAPESPVAYRPVAHTIGPLQQPPLKHKAARENERAEPSRPPLRKR